MASLAALTLVCLITTGQSWVISDRNGKLKRDIRRAIPRFTEQSPARNAFRFMHTDTSEGGMYGLSGPGYVDGDVALVRYDTLSGNTTTIQTPKGHPLTGESLGCLDAVNNVFFFIYEYYADPWAQYPTTGLYPYNLADPSVQYKPIHLPTIFGNNAVGAGDECASDPSTGDIYVFGHDAFNADFQLLLRVSFDARKDSASVTQIGKYSAIDDIPLLDGQSSIFDSKRKMIWLVGEYGADYDNYTIDYFYINASDGALVKTVNFDTAAIDFGAYDPELDTIVGLNIAGRDAKGFLEFEMVHADPQSLAITKTFAPFGNGWCSWGPVYALDVTGGAFYGLFYEPLPKSAECSATNGTYLGHLVGVDVRNGSVLSETPEFCTFGQSLSSVSCPWDLQFWNGDKQ